MTSIGVIVFVYPVLLAAIGWAIAWRVGRQGALYRAKTKAGSDTTIH